LQEEQLIQDLHLVYALAKVHVQEAQIMIVVYIVIKTTLIRVEGVKHQNVVVMVEVLHPSRKML
jgi:predicted DNA-binding transcriptional regulator